MRKIVWAALLFSIFIGPMSAPAQEVWVSKNDGLRSSDVRAIAVNKDGFYIATTKNLYKKVVMQDREKWLSVFSVSANRGEITSLNVIGGIIYLGTTRGLYRSIDYGERWVSIFKTASPEKTSIHAIERADDISGGIVIGSSKGVFQSDDKGERWRDISGTIKNKAVRQLAVEKNNAYALTSDGLYVKEGGQIDWRRIYVIYDEEGTEQNELSDEEPEDYFAVTSCLLVSGASIYIGVGKGIVCSEDGAISWKAFPVVGLGGDVKSLAFHPTTKSLFSATSKGFFEYDSKRGGWEELYLGRADGSSPKKIIVENENGIVWGMTEKGVYRLEPGRYSGSVYADMGLEIERTRAIFAREPSVKELQQAAMKFAELGPDKISAWRTEARLKALLPKVSLSIDRDRSSNSEIYTSATKDYIVVGPEDTSSGYGISVSWETGDLLWSDDQTNIDVRSRLTTQLRNDILDELRRLFYERRRIQFELFNFPADDINRRFEKELRLEELTQAIDDLTGNYLSENIGRT